MEMEKYDLIVIGAGPAGYAAAIRAIDFGKKVCLIEKDKVGGAGIFNGALSSKTLWEISQKVANVNEAIAGKGRETYTIPWSDVQATVDEAVFERKFQYSCHIKLLQNESENRLLKYERGTASFVDANTVSIAHDGTHKQIYGDFVMISTGSKPRKLPNIVVDERIIMTSDGIENIQEYPKSLVIVGAGVIGCEYATIFSNFGRTKVYIIDRQDRILPFEDQDISDIVTRKMEEKGVVVHHNAKLERMEIINGQVEYELLYPDGKRETIQVEKALLSIGREPNVHGLNLEAAGVKIAEKGGTIEDLDTQTNIPNIFTAGDVSGRLALVNIAEIEARHAIEKAFNNQDKELYSETICTIMFLQPEVGAVGINEQQCIEQNIPVKVVKIDFSLIARAIAMRKTEGFFKIIVSNDEKMQVLGMRAVGEHASTAIQTIGLLIRIGMPISVIAELVHPHPSIVEGIQECVRMLMNNSLFKSSIFKDKLACYSLVDGVKTPLERF
jgi:dihydrolipoamide dehydrogenase